MLKAPQPQHSVSNTQTNLLSSPRSCWNHLVEINGSMLNLSLPLYLLTKAERIVLAIEKCLQAHIQFKKPVFPWGLKVFQSFYFSNLYPMHFLLYTMVGPRSRSALGKKQFLKCLKPRLERKNLELKNFKLPRELKNLEEKTSSL